MKVRTHVHVRSEDGTRTAVLAPGDSVPDWAEVTNPAALLRTEDGPAPAPEAEQTATPKAPGETARAEAPKRRRAASKAQPKAE